MKTKLNILVGTAILGTLVLIIVMTTCSPSKTNSVERNMIVSRLVANAWVVRSVSVDGVDRTGMYTGLIIQFSATNFQSMNGLPIWPISGTWTFLPGTVNKIVRNDGTAIDIAFSGSNLTMTMTWPYSSLGGRTQSIVGVHVFVFGK